MTRMIRRWIRISLITCLILAMGISPAFAMSIPVWINNSSAPIYTSTGACGSVRAGTSVYVTAVRNGWAQVENYGYVGYVHTKYLTLKQGIPGYVCKKSYVYQYATTSSATYGPLHVGTQLSVVGLDGDFYQVTNGKALGYIPKAAMSHTKPSDVSIMASHVELLDWNTCNYVFPKGSYAYMYDMMSGAVIRVRRLGGANHAELEPYTAEDTAKLLQVCGGEFSWASRPVIMYNGSHMFVAAINTMPHGEQSIQDNNFEGQFCMHVPGSKTHGSDSVNVNHQQAIEYAWNWLQSKI